MMSLKLAESLPAGAVFRPSTVERAREAKTRPRSAKAVTEAATEAGRSKAAAASSRCRSADCDATSYLRADQSAVGVLGWATRGDADVKD